MCRRTRIRYTGQWVPTVSEERTVQEVLARYVRAPARLDGRRRGHARSDSAGVRYATGPQGDRSARSRSGAGTGPDRGERREPAGHQDPGRQGRPRPAHAPGRPRPRPGRRGRGGRSRRRRLRGG
ncbi:Exonuclease SbcC [Actinacidiphila bryophytorum]|uniref:Exonuclease SbcC n=1 Tax=Actinacidiphila bryophytorum TaxID=1436133 RepID=A0A9W4E759_9ACTN|nr:Exonuclease SbcC [Actinacidiphila bryophytorum]